MAECDLLVEPIFSVRIGEGMGEQATLPGVLSRLGGKKDVFFGALQPHQQHAWYSLLVHLGALSLRALGQKDPAQSEDVYREGLRKLSGLPEWWLVDDHGKPAFLQSPTDARIIEERNRLLTPDEMDMIPCAANHSRKRRRIVAASLEHWVYTLASLQGQCVSVADYRGTVRSTGSGRVCVTLAESLSLGSRYVRDVGIALAERQAIAQKQGLTGKHVLLWLVPWDGDVQLGAADLAPLFLDVPRLVRIVREDKGLVAYRRQSTTGRIQLESCGGDLWTPISRQEGREGRPIGFGGGETETRLSRTNAMSCLVGYGKLHQLVFDADTIKPPSVRHPLEGAGYLLVSGLITNKGKTLGYHERIVPIQSRYVMDLGKDNAESRVAALSREHVEIAALVEGALGQAIWTLMLGEEMPRHSLRKRNEKEHTRILSVFEKALDSQFFEHLFARLEEGKDSPAAWFAFAMQAARAVVESSARNCVHWTGRHHKGIAHATLQLDRFEAEQRKTNQQLGGADEAMIETSETYDKLSDTIGDIHKYIVALAHRDRGAIAKLRRIDVEMPIEEDFFKIESAYVDKSGLPRVSESEREQNRRWTTVVRWTAEAAGLHRLTSTGRALADAGFSNARFERMLNQQDSEVLDACIDSAIRFLRSKRKPFAMTDFAYLYLWPMTAEANDLRRRMAKEYYPAARGR